MNEPKCNGHDDDDDGYDPHHHRKICREMEKGRHHKTILRVWYGLLCRIMYECMLYNIKCDKILLVFGPRSHPSDVSTTFELDWKKDII